MPFFSFAQSVSSPTLSDKVNFVFESLGALFAATSLYALVLDQQVQGVAPAQVIFSGLWAFWCIPYYTELQQTWSLTASSVRAGITLAWAGTYWFWV